MAPPDIFGRQSIKEQSICLLFIVVCYSTDYYISPPPTSDLSLFSGPGDIELYYDRLYWGTPDFDPRFGYNLNFNGSSVTVDYRFNVPEPASLVLMSLALAGLLGYARRYQL